MSRFCLVVEDSSPMGEMISDNLQSDGWVSELVRDGLTALERLQLGGVDVVVLDVMLPGCSGFEVLSQMRARGDQTPVLILSARSDDQDRIRGLELKADDYLTKPFNLQELLLRVRGLLRVGREAVTRRVDRVAVPPETDVLQHVHAGGRREPSRLPSRARSGRRGATRARRVRSAPVGSRRTEPARRPTRVWRSRAGSRSRDGPPAAFGRARAPPRRCDRRSAGRSRWWSSRPATITLSSRVDKTWTGATSTDWSDASNWLPAGVPVATDSVVIPAGRTVELSANVVAGAVSTGLGSTLDLSTFDLTLSGGIDNDGRVIGTGTLRLTDAHPTVCGQVPNVEATQGILTLTADTYATGVFNATKGLAVAGYALRVDGVTTVSEGLTMAGASVIDAQGDLRLGFFGCLDPADLSTGTLRAAGDVYIYACSGSVYVSPGAELIIDGTTAQDVLLFDAPLRRFVVLNDSQAVTLRTSVQAAEVEIAADATVVFGVSNADLTVSGSLVIGEGAVVDIPGRLEVDGVVSVGTGALVTVSTLAAPNAGQLPAVSTTNLEISTTTAIDSVVAIPGNVTVLGAGTVLSLTSTGELRVGQTLRANPNTTIDVDAGTVRVDGAANINGSVWMTHVDGNFDVGDYFYLGTTSNCTSESSQWTAGVLRVGGYFWAAGTSCGDVGVFVASGTHRSVMNGSGLQLVRMEHAAPVISSDPTAPNRFNALEVANGSTGVVQLFTNVTVGGDLTVSTEGRIQRQSASCCSSDRQLRVAGDLLVHPTATVAVDAVDLLGQIDAPERVDAGNFTARAGATLPYGATINDLFVQGDLSVTAPLSIAGVLVVNSGVLTIEAGAQLQVGQSARTDAGTVVTASGTLNIGREMTANGAIRMTQPTSVVSVAGHLSVGSNTGCTSENSQWTAGDLRLMDGMTAGFCAFREAFLRSLGHAQAPIVPIDRDGSLARNAGAAVAGEGVDEAVRRHIT